MLTLLRFELFKLLRISLTTPPNFELEDLVEQEEVMGEILKFRPKKISGNGSEKPSTPGEVLIFPGVRMERKEFSLADRLYLPTDPAQSSCQTRQKTKE